MCDTLAAVGAGRLLFAKNSDRPPYEAQVVEWRAARTAVPARRLRAQYVDVGPDPGALAMVVSRPTWLWGCEHGVNEAGVAVGNEKIWTTDDPHRRPPALLGMDVVRLALERATTAVHGVAVIGELVERHGQGGNGELDRDEPYDSAFLVADRHEAWSVETRDREWVARRVRDGGLAISNRVSLGRDWDAAAASVAPGTDVQSWRAPWVPTGIADHRLAATTACVTGAPPAGVTPRRVAAVLRDHGDDHVPTEPGDDFRGVTVCMHAAPLSVTTASMIAEVQGDDLGSMRVWCALGNPCVSVFVPVFPPHIPAALGDAAQWQPFVLLRERVERDADALAAVRAVLDPVEAELWAQADAVAARDDRERAAFAHDTWRAVDGALHRVDEALRSLGV